MPGGEKRVRGIDVLRGLCIVAVVLHHINIRIRLDKVIGPAAGKVLFWSGYYGVRVFFVISGFLIATWSLKRWHALRNIDLRRFYVMRFARIAPCLLALLALLALLDRGGVPKFTIAAVPQFAGYAPHPSLGRALFAALTFHINWLEARTGYLPGAWDVLWSLSVEEVFYTFFPLLCVLVRKQSLLIALLSGFVVIGPVARTVFARNEIWADYGYLSCMDGIALGCLAALVAAGIRFGKRARLALRASGILLAVFMEVFRGTAARFGLYKTGLDVAVLQIGIALLVIALQQEFDGGAGQAPSSALPRVDTTPRSHPGAPTGRAIAQFPSAIMRWFGRNSYEVYLTHVLVMWPAVMLFQHFHQSLRIAPLWFLGYAALAGALGGVIARFYSEPFNRILRMRMAGGRVES